MIRTEHLGKTFNSEILRDINVEINRGDVISIIGPSGCGKSTFLRCLNMLEKPSCGKVYFEDVELTGADRRTLEMCRRKMGMVFQSFNLFEHMSVIENVMLGPVELLGMDRQSAYDEGMRLLDMVGMAGRAMRYPEELSGGQKQRVAIARTLAMKPEIIFFDEPTSALDPRMVSEVLGVMNRLANNGMTMLIVTHEMSFAENVSNRIFYMDEKGIYEDGTPQQIFHNPQHPRTRDFIYRVRSFGYDIHGPSFDLYDMLGQLAEFMRNHRFDEKRMQKTVLLIEELIYSLLFAAIGQEKTDLHFTFSYAEKSDHVKLEFAGNGITGDILGRAKDEISARLIRGYSEEIEAADGRLTVSL